MWSIALRERGESAAPRRIEPPSDRDGQRNRHVAPGAPYPPPSRPRPAAAVKPWPDPRRLTPRQMADLGHRLFVAGYLGFDDSRLLSCQCELHPDYAATVGRLTGRGPAPEGPRDHVRDWDRRLAFALRYTPDDDERIGRIRRIIAVLARLAATSRSTSPYRARE